MVRAHIVFITFISLVVRTAGPSQRVFYRRKILTYINVLFQQNHNSNQQHEYQAKKMCPKVPPMSKDGSPSEGLYHSKEKEIEEHWWSKNSGNLSSETSDHQFYNLSMG